MPRNKSVNSCIFPEISCCFNNLLIWESLQVSKGQLCAAWRGPGRAVFVSQAGHSRSHVLPGSPLEILGAEIEIVYFHLPSPLCSVGGTLNRTVRFLLMFRQDINWKTSDKLITKQFVTRQGGECLTEQVKSSVSLVFRERSVLFFDIQVNKNTTPLPQNNRLHLLLNSSFLRPEYRFYQDCILLLSAGAALSNRILLHVFLERKSPQDKSGVLCETSVCVEMEQMICASLFGEAASR